MQKGKGFLRHTTPHFVAYFGGILCANIGVGVVESVSVLFINGSPSGVERSQREHPNPKDPAVLKHYG